MGWREVEVSYWCWWEGSKLQMGAQDRRGSLKPGLCIAKLWCRGWSSVWALTPMLQRSIASPGALRLGAFAPAFPRCWYFPKQAREAQGSFPELRGSDGIWPYCKWMTKWPGSRTRTRRLRPRRKTGLIPPCYRDPSSEKWEPRVVSASSPSEAVTVDHMTATPALEAWAIPVDVELDGLVLLT